MIRTDIFHRLQQTITRCRKCPRLVAWRELVAREKVRRYRAQEYWGRPVPALGEPTASLLVIGLAPAAHGANRTGRMFTGDRSGEWLYEALHRSGFANRPVSLHREDGLSLTDCLITAALRCAPPGNKPLPAEIDQCLPYLRQELRLVAGARVIIVLGRIAFHTFLKAWRAPGGRPPGDRMPVFAHGGEWRLPDGPMLISSYHPSQQNTQTGRLTRAMFHSIFDRARTLIDA